VVRIADKGLDMRSQAAEQAMLYARISLLPRAVAGGWAALLLGATLTSRAADAPLPSLEALLGTEVEAVSRHAESLLDAPAAVTAIGRAEAAALGHVTVADMLGRLPGIYVTTSRAYSSVGVRGFNRPGDYNARLLMSIDGYRVNDAIYDQALPGYEFPIVADWVKRVELVSGPAASVYGSNALLGVVNVVTLDGADAPGLRVRSASSGRGTLQLTGQYGLREGDTDLFVGVALHRLRGEDFRFGELDSPTAPGGRIEGLDGTVYRSLFTKLRHGEWRASLATQVREQEVPTAVYGTLPGVPGTRYMDQYNYVELAWESVWRGDWRPALRLDLSHTRFDGDYVYEGSEPALLLNRDVAVATAGGIDARVHYRGWTNHSVIAGAEWRRVFRARQANFDVDPAAVYLERTDQRRQFGLYAQDQMRLSERVLLTLGLRADRADAFDTELSPRVSLVYRASAEESLKLMFGRAFRSPNLAERFYADNEVSQRANPALQPERVSTVELAWQRALGADMRLGANVYTYRLRDLIDFVAIDEEVSQYQNVSGVRTSGIDLDLERRSASGWQWRASLSLARARASGGETLSNSPRWLAKGHLLGPLGGGFSAGLEAQAMGRRESPRGPVASFATVNALLQRSVGTHSSLALKVLNLTDRASFDPASSENDLRQVPRERRSVWLEWQVEL
jgi:outer membrane receptor protein involved in Fe transport